MSAILERPQEILTELPEITFDTSLPSLEQLPDTWDPTLFREHMLNGFSESSAASRTAAADFATQAIQEGHLGALYHSIYDMFVDDPEIQQNASDLVGRTYMAILNDKGMGPDTYNAVTLPEPANYSQRTLNHMNSRDIIDPGY